MIDIATIYYVSISVVVVAYGWTGRDRIIYGWIVGSWLFFVGWALGIAEMVAKGGADPWPLFWPFVLRISAAAAFGAVATFCVTWLFDRYWPSQAAARSK